MAITYIIMSTDNHQLLTAAGAALPFAALGSPAAACGRTYLLFFSIVRPGIGPLQVTSPCPPLTRPAD